VANGIHKQKNPAIRQEFFYKSSRNRNEFQMGVSMDPLPLVEDDSVVYVILEPRGGERDPGTKKSYLMEARSFFRRSAIVFQSPAAISFGS